MTTVYVDPIICRPLHKSNLIESIDKPTRHLGYVIRRLAEESCGKPWNGTEFQYWEKGK